MPRSVRRLTGIGVTTPFGGANLSFENVLAAQSSAPALLPKDLKDFTGRGDELARLSGLVGGGSVVVTAIDGTAGVGKTALAIHAAHNLLHEFPDGNLYADLRGYTEGQEPADPCEILAVFLQYLGVPAGELPADLEQQSGMFRQLLSSRRMLVLLDNAAHEDQVRPLLPGMGSSLVLITSRERLLGLELDERIHLDMLSPREAIELLTPLIGQERAAAEHDDVLCVVSLCGRLPLALRIAGQILNVHPSWRVRRLAELLADEQHRLDELEAGDIQVRSAIGVSYRQLPADDARMFWLLGLLPGADFDRNVAGILAGLEPYSADKVLDRLVLANLVISDPGDRFRLHDLLRLYARQHPDAKADAVGRGRAGDRLFRYYLDKTKAADEHLRALPGMTVPADFASRAGALDWLDAERPNLVAAVTAAAASHRDEVAVDLPLALGQYLYSRRLLDDWLAALGISLKTACQLGDRSKEGKVLTQLGWALFEGRRFAEGITECEKAVKIFQELGDQMGEAEALTNKGLNLREMNRLDEAVTAYQDAAAKFCGRDRRGEGIALTNLGRVQGGLRQFEEAVAACQEAVIIFRDLRDRHEEGGALINLGSALQQAGKPEEAITKYRAAVDAYRDADDPYNRSQTLSILGNAYLELRQAEQAITCYRQALEISQRVGYTRGKAQTLSDLANLYRDLGQPGKTAQFQEAAEITREGHEYDLTELLQGLEESARKTKRRWLHGKSAARPGGRQ